MEENSEKFSEGVDESVLKLCGIFGKWLKNFTLDNRLTVGLNNKTVWCPNLAHRVQPSVGLSFLQTCTKRSEYIKLTKTPHSCAPQALQSQNSHDTQADMI